MTKTKRLLLVGVGGQGTILVSRLISEALLRNGYDVKMSEIHGMSQRGGSVTTQIKFGEKVYTSSIDEGEADVLVAFEKMEAARYMKLLKKEGILLVNDEEIYSVPILAGYEEYPSDLIEELRKKIENTKVINASKVATEIGEPKAQNIVMLGALVKALDLQSIDWIGLIKEHLPEKFHEVNIKAFEKGSSL